MQKNKWLAAFFNACVKYLIIYHEFINTYIPHFKFLHKKHFWFIFSLSVKKKILKIQQRGHVETLIVKSFFRISEI